MIRSMTGFGRGSNSSNGKKFIFEIKTVNHRYTDIYIKSPRGLIFIEDKVREMIGKVMERGKADVFITFEDISVGNNKAIFDEGLAFSYINAFNEISEKYDLKNDITAVRLAQFPDVVKIEKSEVAQEEILAILVPAVEEALRNLIVMREFEGDKLKNDLLSRLEALGGLIRQVSDKAPEVVKEYKEKLESRISELLESVPADPQRLAMEVAVFADKCAIDEEITRFESHIFQFNEILKEGGQMGRKLDFLVQEMNREVNTIGSKSGNIEIIRCVIEMKSEVEKIREQIQNIE